MLGTRESCSCERCQAACRTKPGWYMPGEVAVAAGHLGLSPREFFSVWCAVDWWSTDEDEDVYVIAPRLRGHPGGEEYPPAPGGVCNHLVAGKCALHGRGKPFECRRMLHDDTPEIDRNRKREMIEAWRGHQDEIVALLGRQPQSKPSVLREHAQNEMENAVSEVPTTGAVEEKPPESVLVNGKWRFCVVKVSDHDVPCFHFIHPEFGDVYIALSGNSLTAMIEGASSVLAFVRAQQQNPTRA